MKKRLIYLADLTHTGQSIASNIFPLAIGLLASYINEVYGPKYEMELFKYPHDLNNALQKQMPDIIGFSNYSWNCQLSYQFAKRIKKISPETAVVFGGPNYGLTDPEIQDFWSRFPELDFYIIKEGEIAFVKLLELLEKYDFHVGDLRNAEEVICNAHYFGKEKFVKGELLARIKDLDTLGSPYLKGYMDKFFDSVLNPMIHTTRGCPFTCTFCTEGNPYYSKVAQRPGLKEELEYIAERSNGVPDLYLTDANFGMFVEDIEKAKIIRSVQEKYDWPKRICVSTGKNRKERIVEVAAILDGTLGIAASLQSTDKTILKNINRQNISSDALNTIVEKAQQLGTTTYTELILCLPGDSLEAHLQSLKDVVDSGLDNIRMYQLILLPQTEMCTPESRAEYGLVTRFRINPRSFGKYAILGEAVASIESEEIVVANKTLPIEKYIVCREIDFTIEFLHNTQLFIELEGFCKFFKMSWFDFIVRFYHRARHPSSALKELYDDFKEGNLKGLWDSWEELNSQAEGMIDDLLKDGGGTNEMVKGKALAFFKFFSAINDLIYREFREYRKDHRLDDPCLSLYWDQLKELNYWRKNDFLRIFPESPKMEINFDIEKMAALNYQCDPREFYSDEPLPLDIHHDEEQIEKINSYLKQYGTNVEGLGRILMRAPVGKLFRTVKISKYSHRL